MAASSYEPDDSQSDSGARYTFMESSPAGPSSSKDAASDRTPSPGTDRRPPRRHRNQASSTFRLESPRSLLDERSDSRSRTLRQNPPLGSVVRRGKEPVRHQHEESQLVLPKRASQQRHQGHASKPSIGSSPLSNVVSHEELDPKDPSSAQGASAHAHPRAPSSTGLDTDSAQIVNLALSLSDSRRRNSLTRSASGSIQRPRLSSSIVLSKPSAIHSPKLPETETQSQDPSTLRETVNLKYGTTHYGEVQLSEATLARAERAKQHFELFGNYLRLLSYLPPLPTPGEPLGKFRDTRDSQTVASEGRKYNPLQYLRNRKVRFRERQAIDSEAAGWGDVRKVTAWVDSIAGSAESSRLEAQEYPTLPPFNPSPHIRTEETPGSRLAPTNSRTGDIIRRRPRMDWVTTPLDLLADVVWYERDENRAKAEDRNGNKLFLPVVTPTSKPKLHATRPDVSYRDGEASRHPSQGTKQITPAGPRRLQNTERGRLRNRLAQSMKIPPSHNPLRNQSGSPTKRRTRSSSHSSNRSQDSITNRQRKRLFASDSKDELLGDHSVTTPGTIYKVERPITPNRPILDFPLGPGSTQSDTSNYGKLLPPLNMESDSHPHSRPGYATSSSSAISDSGVIESKNYTAPDDNSPFSSPVQRGLFPKVTMNLSPLRGRSASPNRRRPFSLTHSRKSSRQVQGPYIDSPEAYAEAKKSLNHRHTHANFSPTLSPSTSESHKHPTFRRADSSPAKYPRNGGQQEWKRILKGGRLAEIVGNEVSRVGDLIRKREHLSHSRRSSASSLSEYIDAEPISDGDLVRDQKKISSDDLRQISSTSRSGAKEATDLYQGTSNSMTEDEFSPDIYRSPGAQDSLRLSQDTPTQKRVRSMTRHWSLSDRKIAHSGRIGKREISRVRTHLLSSGIKAVEICRYAEKSPKSCFDSWLRSPINHNSIAPYIASSEASALATSKAITAFHERKNAYNALMKDFTDVKAPPLKAEIRRLENLVLTTLTPRLRSLASQTESLTNDMGTSSTLPVKHLDRLLDKGLRRRHRQIRSFIRFLSAIFEWIIMWFFWALWICVMFWKLVRLIGLGTFRGIRWVLWL